MAILLYALAGRLGPQTLRLTKKALQALIEMCAGNYLNQEAAFKGQAVVSIMKIISHSNKSLVDKSITQVRQNGVVLPYFCYVMKYVFPQKHCMDIMRLKASAVELFEVLLEETSEHSQELAKGMFEDVDVSCMVSFMDEQWKLQQQIDEHQAKMEAYNALYRAFHVLCKMADYLGLTWMELIG